MKQPLGGKVCSVDGCALVVRCKGLCQLHYHRKKIHGTTERQPHWRAPNGAGTTTNSGYRMVARKLEHRNVMESVLGRELESHETVHHINGDRLDNRPENLELWSSRQPKGQRVVDKVSWAKEILRMYDPESLK